MAPKRRRKEDERRVLFFCLGPLGVDVNVDEHRNNPTCWAQENVDVGGEAVVGAGAGVGAQPSLVSGLAWALSVALAGVAMALGLAVVIVRLHVDARDIPIHPEEQESPTVATINQAALDRARSASKAPQVALGSR
mgnify:CR=1 FL=1